MENLKSIGLGFGILFLASKVTSQTFVSPIGYISNEINKQKVLSFIHKQVKDDYTAIGMNDPMILRMMEKVNYMAFQQLTQAENRPLLKAIIRKYCSIGMCNYHTIWMMYDEQDKAGTEPLK